MRADEQVEHIRKGQPITKAEKHPRQEVKLETTQEKQTLQSKTGN